MSSRARGYWQAARPAAFPMVAVPLVLGWGMASGGWGELGALLLFGMVAQIQLLYFNDWADQITDGYAPAQRLSSGLRVSGGSRAIQDGLISPRALRRAARVATGAMLLVAGATSFVSGHALVLVFGAAFAFLGWAYSAPPLRLAYRGHGEWVQGLSLGFLLPGYALALCAHPSTLLDTLPQLTPFVLGFAALNIITALPDLEADAAAHKRCYPVRHGVRRSRRAATLGLLLASLGVGVVLFFRGAPWAAGAIGLALLLVIAAARSPRLSRYVLLSSGAWAWVATASAIGIAA